MNTVFKLLHSENAYSPTLTPPKGRVIVVRPLRLNALFPMLETSPGMVALFRFVQLSNALAPMVLVLPGFSLSYLMSTLSKPEQP